MLRQQLPHGRVHRIADFLSTGGRGGDFELLRESNLVYQILHDKFCHRAAADVAVADKKYLCHVVPPGCLVPFQYSMVPILRRGQSVLEDEPSFWGEIIPLHHFHAAEILRLGNVEIDLDAIVTAESNRFDEIRSDHLLFLNGGAVVNFGPGKELLVFRLDFLGQLCGFSRFILQIFRFLQNNR